MKYTLQITITSSVLILAYNIFEWDIVDLVSVFLISLISGPVYIFFWISCILSIVFLFLKWKSLKLKAVYPFLVCVSTVWLLLSVPFVKWKILADFYLNQGQMNEVVAKVRSGKISGDEESKRSVIMLPEEYRSLSKGGGKIVVPGKESKPYVFFYTFRGVMTNFAGYIHHEGTLDYQNAIHCRIVGDLKLDGNWRWISCH